MTEENRKLLLIDLCARVFYNVKCKVYLDTKGYCLRDEDKYCDDTLESVNCRKQTCTFNKSIGYNFGNFAIEDVKPYLRSMSSMTDKEYVEYSKLWNLQDEFPTDADIRLKVDVFDWLNKHHFDYRGLIKKGLALEAPEGMYNLNK
jgi:hypothetical protein